jgi:radical SAM superfamily enzyme YgiQ (UPF0313 family)
LGTFPSEVRPEFVTKDAVDLVRRFCANDNITLGAQSGSDAMLGKIHRGLDADAVVSAAQLIRNAGLIPNVDFIFGLPGETDWDRAATFRMIEELKKIGAKIHTHAFLPLAGTPMQRETPSTIDGVSRRKLELLETGGAAFGSWKRQEMKGLKLANYFQK